MSAAHLTIALANAALALLSGTSSVAGAIRPALGLPKGAQVTAGVDFYARAYAARALPLALVALVLIATGSWSGLVGLLVVLGTAQAADSALGVNLRNPGMAVGAGLGALVHLGSAWWIATH